MNATTFAEARAALMTAPEVTAADLREPLAASDWPEPQPLRRELPAPDPFPIDALGPLLSPTAREILASVQCPEAMAGSSLLAAAALAVQPFADVIVDGRTSPLSLDFVTVAESGERKSSVDRLVCKPHREWQRMQRTKHDGAITSFSIEYDAWKKARTDAMARAKGMDAITHALKELGAAPEKPIDPFLYTEEPTYEGLVKLLGAERPSLGLFSDEGGRFLGGYAMSSENAIKTASGLSKLWDGDPITRTRAGDGTSVLYGRRLSLHLMIQPTIAPLLYSNHALVGQGILSRMLPVYPTSTIGGRPYRSGDVTEAPAYQRYAQRLTGILDTDLPIREGTRNTLDPRLFTLDPEAKREYIGFHDHIERMCAGGRELESVRGFAAKAPEHALRIAGVLELVGDLNAPVISLANMAAGIELAQFYIGEALRLKDVAEADPDLTLAERVLAWARASATDGRFATTTLYQRGPRGVRDKAGAERVLKILAGHGWVRRLNEGSVVDGKPRRNAWAIRP